MHSCNHPCSASGFPEWFLVPSGKGFSSYLAGSVRNFQERSSALGVGFCFLARRKLAKTVRPNYLKAFFLLTIVVLTNLFSFCGLTKKASPPQPVLF